MTRIPITLALRPGYEDDPSSYRSPVIEIAVGTIPIADSRGIVTRTSPRLIRALIDTGADPIVIDEQVIKEIGATNLGRGAATSTFHADTVHDEYLVNLHLPTAGKVFGARVTALPLNNGRRAYEAVLGMEFLKLGRLVLDSSGHSFFELRT